MSRVMIVFADGSKQMSHNLDETRERWELQHEVDAEDILREIQQGYSAIVVDESSSYEELTRAVAFYKSADLAIASRQATLSDYPNLDRERKKLYRCRLEINSIGALARELLKNERIKISEGENERRGKRVANYAHLLEQILIDHGITLPPKPLEDWKTVDQTGEARRQRAHLQEINQAL